NFTLRRRRVILSHLKQLHTLGPGRLQRAGPILLVHCFIGPTNRVPGSRAARASISAARCGAPGRSAYRIATSLYKQSTVLVMAPSRSSLSPGGSIIGSSASAASSTTIFGIAQSSSLGL